MYNLTHYTEPLVLKVNFEHDKWALKLQEVHQRILFAVATDISVQWLVGAPSLITIAVSLLTALILWHAPTRLIGAVASLFISQALVSLLLVTLLTLAGLDFWLVELAGILWFLWCVVCLIKLTLTYIKTPKRNFRP